MLHSLLETRTVQIIDGLRKPLKTWAKHVQNVLRRCKLVPLNAIMGKPKSRAGRGGKLTLSFELEHGDTTTWEVTFATSVSKQVDGHSCGQRACWEILGLFDQLDADKDCKDSLGIRRMVMSKFSSMVRSVTPDLFVPRRVSLVTVDDDDGDGDVASSNTVPCQVCHEPITMAFPGLEMTCCGATEVHKLCLKDWFQFQSNCIFCRATVDMGTFLQDSRVVASPVKGADAQLLLEMKKGGPTMLDSVRKRRQEGVEARQKRQKIQAQRMKDLHGEDLEDVGVGTVVNLKMDYRDVSHARGVNGVVCRVSPNDPGSVALMTCFGIIAFGVQKKLYFVPSDCYRVLPDEVLVNTRLEQIQVSLLDKSFHASEHKKVTMQEAHSELYGHSPGRKLKCNCKSQNCQSCRCSKAGEPCTSACACNGSCKNPNN